MRPDVRMRRLRQPPYHYLRKQEEILMEEKQNLFQSPWYLEQLNNLKLQNGHLNDFLLILAELFVVNTALEALQVFGLP